MDVRWRFGIFLGRSLSSDQNVIGLSDGTVTRARAMTRVVPSLRWSRDRVENLLATPIKERLPPQSLDDIEAETNPRDHDAGEMPEDDLDPAKIKRRLKIELKDVKRYGPSPGCNKCLLHSRGKSDLAQKEHHTEACRERMYRQMKAAGASKYLQAEKADAERIKSKTKPPRVPAEASTAPKADAPVDGPKDGDQMLEVPEDPVDPQAEPQPAHEVSFR